MQNIKFSHFIALIALVCNSTAFAGPLADDFTVATDKVRWIPINYACLTAGTATNNTSANSTIPGCNYSTPDPVGIGALRLTPADYNKSGAIVSIDNFPTKQGLQATFTTYTYGGDSGGNAGAGADGISFFLLDGATGAVNGSLSPPLKVNYDGKVGGGAYTNSISAQYSNKTSTTAMANIGAFGGSLAYSCANVNSPASGLTGAYLGLGMDEYGNFLNGGNGNDNTSTGIPVQNSSTSSHGYNSFGYGTYQPNRIGIRGAGNVSWYYLHDKYPDLYTDSSENVGAVQATCQTGLIQNGTNGTQTYSVSAMSWANNVLTVTVGGKLNLTVYETVNIANTGGSPPQMSNGASVVGSNYTVTSVNLSTNTFTVNFLGGSTGSVKNASNGQVSINIANYAVIPGGYWVLPDNQLIANESATQRSSATPINYKLVITSNGLLSLSYLYGSNTVYQPVLTDWPITASNGPLPKSFRFGFAASTGGSTNAHEITCFSARPIESSSSAGANTVQAGQVRTGTKVYLASYNPNTWNGSLVSDALVNTNGVISVASTADWDANCVLTGGGCAPMGTTNGIPNNTIAVEAPANRVLLGWNGSTGKELTYSNLSSAQISVINADGNGSARLDWLRGVRTNEQGAGGSSVFRARAGVLGDIVDSSPLWIGPPSMGYSSTFVDSLYGAGAESSYATFSSALAQRQHVAYVGSNDGFMHGFRAGTNNTDGSLNSASSDGYEVLGFMPASVLASSNVVSMASSAYTHNSFVDAAPGFGDLYYNGSWHTWLVSGIGGGGKEVFALDVTDPTGVTTGYPIFSASNASSIVSGDWTSSSMTSCTNATSNCGSNMGYSYGTPLVRRLHNGKWAIIFGNGLGSSSGSAGVYVGVVDSSNGAVSYVWLDTGWNPANGANGITYASSADLDGDRVVDYLYAGDLQGNVWRFDLTSGNSAQWAVSKFGQSSATPLFVAKDGSGKRQPITTKIAITSTITGGGKRVIVGFGTGRALSVAGTASKSYASGTQSVYGIWDWDMAAWNTLSTAQYSSLAQVNASPYRTIPRSSLVSDSASGQTTSTRETSVFVVCWMGSSACATGNSQYGWVSDLPGSSEQIIYNPVFSGGELFVNTVIPPVTYVGQCTLPLPSGWTMGFDLASGGGSAQNVFPDANGSLVVPVGHNSITAIKQNAVGTPYVVSVGSQQYIVNQTSDGSPVVNRINPQGGVKVKQVSWEQLR